jgi:hypothetical protein
MIGNLDSSQPGSNGDYKSGPASIFSNHARRKGCPPHIPQDVDGKIICGICGEQLERPTTPAEDDELAKAFRRGK